MRKLLPLMVVSIFVLSGLGAVAIQDEQQIENQPSNIQPHLLEINVNGVFLGYKVTITNVGNVTINGTINMTITTNAPFIPMGSVLSLPGWNFGLTVSNSASTFLRPAIGLGPVNVTVSGEVVLANIGTFQYSAWGTGFIFLIYILCTIPTITIP